MARPLRIEFPGAVYHLTSRGNARLPIFADNKDKRRFLLILGEVVQRFNRLCYGYSLTEIAGHLGLHYTTISKIVKQHLG